MSWLRSLAGRARPADRTPARSLAGTLDTLLMTWGSTAEGDERVRHNFTAYVTEGYAANGVVWACILARLLLFSEARFVWRDRRDGKLFGNADLALLEQPWPNGTTGDLLARMEQDVSLAGNAYVRVVNAADGTRRLERLRPDLVSILAATRRRGSSQVSEILGYGYSETPGAPAGDMDVIPVEEMAHWAPIPDPLAAYRGMSWLTPVVREIDADTLMTRHKGKFFQHAATPNAVVKAQQVLPAEVKARLRDEVAARHEGIDNAYKTMIIDAGADFTVVGSTFEQMSFSTVQAAGENRIAAAAGVPGIVVGLKEGLQAATYSNYAQAMRRFCDLTMRPNWRSAAAALARLVPVPAVGSAHLWYDTRDIAALREGERERAETAKLRAQVADLLVRAGYDPAGAARFAETGENLGQLAHTGAIPAAPPPPDPAADAADAAAEGQPVPAGAA